MKNILEIKNEEAVSSPSDPINFSFPLGLRELRQVLPCSRSLH